MSEHTEGPWRSTPVGIVNQDCSVKIADVNDHWYGKTPEETAANSRLICAAPEMMRALERVALYGEHTAYLSIGHTAALQELGRHARYVIDGATAVK